VGAQGDQDIQSLGDRRDLVVQGSEQHPSGAVRVLSGTIKSTRLPR